MALFRRTLLIILSLTLALLPVAFTGPASAKAPSGLGATAALKSDIGWRFLRAKNGGTVYGPHPSAPVVRRRRHASVGTEALGVSATVKVFVSYRRTKPDRITTDFDSIHLARHVKDYLQPKGYEVFLDVDDIRGEPFPERIRREIQDADWFIIVVTSCSHDLARLCEPQDWVRQEIQLAAELDKDVVVVTHGDDVELPELHAFLDDWKEVNRRLILSAQNRVVWEPKSHESFQHMLQRSLTRQAKVEYEMAVTERRLTQIVHETQGGITVRALSEQLALTPSDVAALLLDHARALSVEAVGPLNDYSIVKPARAPDHTDRHG